MALLVDLSPLFSVVSFFFVEGKFENANECRSSGFSISIWDECMQYTVEYLYCHKNRTNFVIKSTKSFWNRIKKVLFCFVLYLDELTYQQKCSKGETLEVGKHSAAPQLVIYIHGSSLWWYYFSFPFSIFTCLNFHFCVRFWENYFQKHTFHMRPFSSFLFTFQ